MVDGGGGGGEVKNRNHQTGFVEKEKKKKGEKEEGKKEEKRRRSLPLAGLRPASSPRAAAQTPSEPLAKGSGRAACASQQWPVARISDGRHWRNRFLRVHGSFTAG